MPPQPHHGETVSFARRRFQDRTGRPVSTRLIAVAIALAVTMGVLLTIVLVSGRSAGPQLTPSNPSLASTLDDWEASVCARTASRGPSSILPAAIAVDQCASAHGNPIIVGTYSSYSALEADVGHVPYDAPYATLTDADSGAAWMFVAFEASNPGENTRRVLDPEYQATAPEALAPLSAFGFEMHHLG